MAESPLRIEYEYFPDPTRGRPVSNGAVYVGLPNTDPTVLANRVDVVLIQQNGNRVILQPSEQPFGTSPGGVIEYQGSPAIIRVDGTVAIAVHDSIGDQVYYNPLANETISTGGGGGSGSSGTPPNGSFEVETNPGIPDDWTLLPASNGTIAIDSTNQDHGFKSLKFTSSSAAGAGIATSDRFNTRSASRSDIRFSIQSTSINVLNTVAIRYYDASNNVLTTNTVFSDGASNPATFSPVLVTDLAPTGAIECEIELTGVSSGGAVTNGSTWFDDVVIENITGSYQVGEDGSVIRTIDQTNSVNYLQMSSGSVGVSPTIDQFGADDLGVLIENILMKNGVITADLTGDVTAGDVNSDTASIDIITAKTLDGNLNINSNGAGGVFINGLESVSLVVLDTPEQITSSLISDTWTTEAYSTLVNAGAKKAILKILLNASPTAFPTVNAYIRKTGSGLTNDGITQVVRALNTGGSASEVTEFIVNLSVASEFDWNTSAGFLTELYLVGYYI